MESEWYQSDIGMEFDSWYLLFRLLIPDIKMIPMKEVGNEKPILEEVHHPLGMGFNLENDLNKYQI